MNENNYAPKNEKMYHINLSNEMLEGAQYAIIPGDPHRSKMIAEFLDKDAKFLSDNRGLTSYLANFCDNKILIISSGMGASSTSICVEELAMIGIKYFIRAGTSGSIQPHIKVGDLVISKAAVRLDGTSEHYAPIQYPAVASRSITSALNEGAKKLGIKSFVSVTATSSSFFPGQERYDNFSNYVIRKFQNSVEELKKLNVANFEMEAATLFIMTSIYNLRGACICAIVAEREKTEHVNLIEKEKAIQNLLMALKEGLKIDLIKRGLYQI